MNAVPSIFTLLIFLQFFFPMKALGQVSKAEQKFWKQKAKMYSKNPLSLKAEFENFQQQIKDLKSMNRDLHGQVIDLEKELAGLDTKSYSLLEDEILIQKLKDSLERDKFVFLTETLVSYQQQLSRQTSLVRLMANQLNAPPLNTSADNTTFWVDQLTLNQRVIDAVYLASSIYRKAPISREQVEIEREIMKEVFDATREIVTGIYERELTALRSENDSLIALFDGLGFYSERHLVELQELLDREVRFLNSLKAEIKAPPFHEAQIQILKDQLFSERLLIEELRKMVDSLQGEKSLRDFSEESDRTRVVFQDSTNRKATESWQMIQLEAERNDYLADYKSLQRRLGLLEQYDSNFSPDNKDFYSSFDGYRLNSDLSPSNAFNKLNLWGSQYEDALIMINESEGVFVMDWIQLSGDRLRLAISVSRPLEGEGSILHFDMFRLLPLTARPPRYPQSEGNPVYWEEVTQEPPSHQLLLKIMSQVKSFF